MLCTIRFSCLTSKFTSAVYLIKGEGQSKENYPCLPEPYPKPQPQHFLISELVFHSNRPEGRGEEHSRILWLKTEAPWRLGRRLSRRSVAKAGALKRPSRRLEGRGPQEAEKKPQVEPNNTTDHTVRR